MTEQHFIHLREDAWKDFEFLLNSNKKNLRARAAEFPAMLRGITGDLNTAKANGFNPALVERLNRLTLDGNQLFYSHNKIQFKNFALFFYHVFPQSVRAGWRSFFISSALFYGAALFSALLCLYKTEFTQSLLGHRTMNSLSEMYNKESVYYLKEREVSTDADMFAFYIYNNISITFVVFASGIFAGAGSLFILAANGVFLGASAAHIINSGFTETFFSFVSGHSAFELTGIVLGAQAGLLLGYSFFVTRGLSRAASLRRAGKTAFPLIAGAALLDFLAAIIEAFWSSKHEIASSVHFIFGAAMWLLLICFFIFAGKPKVQAE